MFKQFVQNRFLFSELVKKDFKTKYKRTILGMGWSLLSPLLNLLVMKIIFEQFFGRGMDNFTTYLFAGNLVYGYFRESTSSGMSALNGNAEIIRSVNISKYLFLISKNVSSLINFGLTLVIFFLFAIIDGVTFHINFFLLVYPIMCLLVFNIGVGFILSALYVFFKDVQYLYDIFVTLLMYLSAIFYTIDTLPYEVQRLFRLNPIFTYIQYFRNIVLFNTVPSVNLHLLCAVYAVSMAAIGMIVYYRYKSKFIYYL
jgi:ABC-type polysaccharide/polyol phosphate export permease